MIWPSLSRVASWKIRRVLTSMPVGAADGQHDVLDGGQGAEGVADEVGVAGRVDQVDLLAVQLEVEQVAVDGEVAAFLLVVDVGDAGAVVDRAAAIGGAGGEEQGVGQGWSCPTPHVQPGQCSGYPRCDRSWSWRLVSPRIRMGSGCRLAPANRPSFKIGDPPASAGSARSPLPYGKTDPSISEVTLRVELPIRERLEDASITFLDLDPR